MYCHSKSFTVTFKSGLTSLSILDTQNVPAKASNTLDPLGRRSATVWISLHHRRDLAPARGSTGVTHPNFFFCCSERDRNRVISKPGEV